MKFSAIYPSAERLRGYNQAGLAKMNGLQLRQCFRDIHGLKGKANFTIACLSQLMEVGTLDGGWLRGRTSRFHAQ